MTDSHIQFDERIVEETCKIERKAKSPAKGPKYRIADDTSFSSSFRCIQRPFYDK